MDGTRTAGSSGGCGWMGRDCAGYQLVPLFAARVHSHIRQRTKEEGGEGVRNEAEPAVTRKAGGAVELVESLLAIVPLAAATQ